MRQGTSHRDDLRALGRRTGPTVDLSTPLAVLAAEFERANQILDEIQQLRDELTALATWTLELEAPFERRADQLMNDVDALIRRAAQHNASDLDEAVTKAEIWLSYSLEPEQDAGLMLAASICRDLLKLRV
jgi:hypothetical protein